MVHGAGDRLRYFKAQSVRIQGADLVGLEPMGEAGAPLLMTPRVPGIELANWARSHREEIQRLLIRHGALLFRGFDASLGVFEQLTTAISDELLDDLDRPP